MSTVISTRKPPRRNILLAMGYFSHERQLGIVRYARRANWTVDFRLPLFHAIEQVKEYIDSTKYDGVLALLSKAAPWMTEFVSGLKLPTVDMWNDYPQYPFPRVLLDNYQIGKIGAEHFLARGFDHYLFYSHTVEGKSGQLRAQGFLDAIRAAGKYGDSLFWDHQSPENKKVGRLGQLKTFLMHKSHPLAVMASNDHLAAEVLDVAESLELNVPRDVAILGVNNDPHITELARVPLSSIDSSIDQVGFEAARLLDQILDGVAAPGEPIRVPPRAAVTRQSSDILATQDSEVSTAIQFIQDHFHQPIGVDDIANECTISRRLLQDRFLKHTGRTLIEMINTKRLEHAQNLLLQPGMKLQNIAKLCGYGSGERLSKAFRATLKMTPSEFRAKNGLK